MPRRTDRAATATATLRMKVEVESRPRRSMTLRERTVLRRVYDRLGEIQAAKHFGVSRYTLLRAIAGVSIRRATAVALRGVIARDEIFRRRGTDA